MPFEYDVKRADPLQLQLLQTAADTLRADSYSAAVRFTHDRPTSSCSGSGRGRPAS